MEPLHTSPQGEDDDSFWIKDELGWQNVSWDGQSQLRNSHGEVADTEGVVEWSPDGPGNVSWNPKIKRFV